MPELETSQLIKLIIGAVVIVVVVVGVGLAFKNKFFDFFENMPGVNSSVDRDAGVSGGGSGVSPPDKKCEDCGGGYLNLDWCEKDECMELGDYWLAYSRTRGIPDLNCRFVSSGLRNLVLGWVRAKSY